MTTATVGLSVLLHGSIVLGGLGAGLVAVWIARVIPLQMDLEERHRASWWWVAAVAVGGMFGWLVAPAVDGALVPAYLTFGAATLGLALIDIDHQLLPNRVLFPAIGIGAVLLVFGALFVGSGGLLFRALVGGFAYFAILLVVAALAHGGFGMGDVKLAVLLGMFLASLGWGQLAVGFSLAVLLGGVAAILLLVFTRRGRAAKFAYGPYLVIGSWVAVFWGREIIDWYMGSGS